ncbi:hypothetical protein JXL21_09015 [Candidatus Bathyarchaeota archaeon]|nr:hypothetical protein [Candidatus Bathyarchaeota archaeon]
MAKLWLYNQLCHTVEEEVRLNHLGLLRFCELDNKKVIDVVGVGLKYLDQRRRRLRDEEYKDFELDGSDQYVFGYNVLRGVEVKVSRSDFRNGFTCTGCNYNYLLTPMRLVSPGEVPKGVGLIEYNRYKFGCDPAEEDEDYPERRPFRLTGLRVVKPATYRRVPQFHIDHVINEISMRRRSDNLQPTYLSVVESLGDPELRYSGSEAEEEQVYGGEPDLQG